MIHSALLSLLCVVACSALGVPGVEKLEGRILEMDACPDAKDLAVVQDDVVFVKTKDQHYSASGKITIKETISGPVRVKVLVYKCKDVKVMSSCEQYTSFDEDGCKELDAKEGTLYDMFTRVHSNVSKCPITPREVNFTGMEVPISDNVAALAKAITSVWYAVIQVTGIINDIEKLVMCTDAWLHIIKEEPNKQYSFGPKG